MAAARASSKIDWAKIGSSLGLRGNTATQLQAFKKRNDDARRRLQQLGELPQSVDFQHYRSVLNNKSIVDEIEGQVKSYKVQTYDVSRQLKAIDSFEAQAVKDAQDTAKLVDTELTALQSALKNIESARPFDECTVEEIMAAEPSIEKKVEAMTKNHRWMPAGYKEKFGDLSVL